VQRAKQHQSARRANVARGCGAKLILGRQDSSSGLREVIPNHLALLDAEQAKRRRHKRY
jgi:hypothetical protein